MSSAFYPLGMNSMPASGYNHRSTYFNKQYISWKGTGVNSNPVGTAPGHIRPLTNNDPGNVFQTGFGLARPLKHFRKGRVIPPNPITGVPDLIAPDPYNKNKTLVIDENALINYNVNRYVKTSKGTSLGGGFGGSGLLNDMQDKPGAFTVKLNPLNEIDGVQQMNTDCATCEGVGIVANYYPNKFFLQENPEPNVENKRLCCNEERKAKRRVVYASTNLKKNYYTTTKQYLQNRCQTYEQKAFNFNQPNPVVIQDMLNAGISPAEIASAKPGSALATTNTYVANCFPNAEIYDATEYALVAKLLNHLLEKDILTQAQVNAFEALEMLNFDALFEYLQSLPIESQKVAALAEFEAFISNPYWGVPFSGPSNPNGCKLTVYKPNNPQYAVQGAVLSSTRMLKLNVDTISTNAASIQRYTNRGVNANKLYSGVDNDVANLYKNKAPNCNTPWPLNFYQSGQFQNKKLCNYQRQLPQYATPKTQPSPYRYYPGTVFSSNHFAQSPVNPLMG